MSLCLRTNQPFLHETQQRNQDYINPGFLLSLPLSCPLQSTPSSMTSSFSPFIKQSFELSFVLASHRAFIFFSSPDTFHLQLTALSTLCSYHLYLHHQRPSCLTDAVSDPQHLSHYRLSDILLCFVYIFAPSITVSDPGYIQHSVYRSMPPFQFISSTEEEYLGCTIKCSNNMT